MGTTTPHRIGPSVASIRAALEKILASPAFASSDRLTRFLRYVVDETLEGRADALKETIVGVDVFGRKPAYDPRLDGVVRTEAIKLRARLKEYYETEGQRDAIRIDMPKGGYVPSFSEQEQPPDPPRGPVVSGRWIVLAVVLFSAAMTTVAGVWLFSRPRATGIPPPSIAVLPFVDLSEEKNQEYFCDGMTEQIIDALSRVQGFQVVARSSVFALKGKQQDIREIGQRFNVRTVLEGSVRRAGSRVRVTAQLNNVADGFHLWSQTYDREMKDIFALEDEISHDIVETLQIKLAGAALKASKASPADPAAYDLYLRGRYLHFKWRQPEVIKSIDLFKQAIDKDPNYALAYAGLADSYTWLGFFRMRSTDVMPKARAAAEKALALDPGLDSARVALGEVKSFFDYDWEGARLEFDRALEINPACANARFSRALTYLAPLGRTKEAIEEMKRAREAEPLNVVFATYLGALYYLDRQFDTAIAQLRLALELDPAFAEAHGMLFKIYLDNDRLAEAKVEDEWIRSATGQAALCDVQVSAREGHNAAARTILAEVQKATKDRYISAVNLACAHLVLGEKGRALDELERAYTEHEGMLAFIKTWPALDGLRTEPRFQALLVKLGLAGR